MAKATPPTRSFPVFLEHGALHKGLLGGSRGWRALYFVLFGSRLARKLFGKPAETIAVERLKPGHMLRIETIKPLSRRERKAMKR